MKISRMVFIVLVAILTQSCAIIFSGTKSGVKVKGMPEGASVYYNGNLEGTAPCKVKVSKNALKNGNTKIQIKQEGYQDSEVTLGRKIKVGAVVGDFIIFPIGHIVDFATGAIYKPYPGSIDYDLTPESNATASVSFKKGDKVIFTFEKYKNTEGEIVAVFPNRALIKFKVENNIAKKKVSGEDFSDKEVEVPFINISKQ